jgi:hypothetical protein
LLKLKRTTDTILNITIKINFKLLHNLFSEQFKFKKISSWG